MELAQVSSCVISVGVYHMVTTNKLRTNNCGNCNSSQFKLKQILMNYFIYLWTLYSLYVLTCMLVCS